MRTTYKTRHSIHQSNVVSWTKGLRYRPNRKQCRESRGIVGYINVSSVLSSEPVSWRRHAWPWLRAFSGHVRDKAGKDKRDAKGGVSWDAGENECKRRTVWVEKRKRASADAEDESYREWFDRDKTFVF